MKFGIGIVLEYSPRDADKDLHQTQKKEMSSELTSYQQLENFDWSVRVSETIFPFSFP